MRCVASVEALLDPDLLADVVGSAVADLHTAPMPGVGYSNSSLQQVNVQTIEGAVHAFVLKVTSIDEDWTARLTGDSIGREAALLTEAAFGPLWDIFASPYVAIAIDRRRIGLLQRDLTTDLLPDSRTPLTDGQEGAILNALAQMHARFWEHQAVRSLGWLTRASQYCDVLAPAVAHTPDALAVLSPQLSDAVPRGWASALVKLPADAARHLTCRGAVWEDRWADVPRTLLHGDVKVANFAVSADGRVAAFDWAMAGSGPCAIDLGWYIAVNASRLTGSKEQIIQRYRDYLTRALGRALPDTLWSRLEQIAVVTGARMLLWSKALALDADRPGAREEWNWWVERLGETAGTPMAREQRELP